MLAEQRALTSGMLIEAVNDEVIGDEPGNTGKDQEAAEKALS